MYVASLHQHPLKSAAVVDVDRLDITARGPVGDRRWLAVDADGRFLTAREHPTLVRIDARVADGGLRLIASGMPPLHVSLPPSDAPRLRVQVWGDTVEVARADEAAAAWITRYLGFPAQLVHMDEAAHRPIDPGFAAPGDEVSFADGYPLLVISQAALDGLNARLARPIPMSRFRPNVVVARCAPHAEDHWQRVRIGRVEFDAVKTCTRCVFTTLDPATALRDPDGEPLRTLKDYRRTPAGITFGMNLIPRGGGMLRVGDAIEVLAAR